MLKVCKFGGSSLSSTEQFEKVKAIIDADKDRKIIVVSAIGKRDKNDNKITDLLYLTFQHVKYNVDFKPVFNQIRSRYLKVRDDLHLNLDLESEFDSLEKRLASNSISEEELVSRGEYFSAKVVSAYLGYDFVDAKDLICFDYDGKVDEKETLQCIEDACKQHTHMVVPGFYGSYPNFKICLFSRGGSDVTGSYMAAGAQADMYENFTDVSGFLMADPRIIENPRRIHTISYAELRELSYMGANVIHEETINPLIQDKIPLVILNTNHPEEGGTWIKEDTPDKKHLITGLTGKKHFVSMTFTKARNYTKLSAILAVLRVFEKYHINIEHVPTSIDSFSIVVEDKFLEEKYYDIVAELKELDEVVSISEDEDIALVAIVGRNMAKQVGTSGRIMSVFGEEKINIKLIDQGREETNIIIGISNADFERSIQALYNRFAHEKVN